MKRNMHMQKARSKKDDEFYTRYEDVENKLKWYSSEFQNKILYLPCDGVGSNFWKYFYKNYEKIKYKKIITTSINSKDMVVFDGSKISTSKIASGDFRENEKIFRECDIVVTNPPFSLANTFYKMLKKTDCEYFFVGNILSNTEWADDVLKFKNYVSSLNAVKFFERPDGSHKVVPTYWYSSFQPSKKEFGYIDEDVDAFKKYYGTEIWKIKRYLDIKYFNNKKDFFTLPITSIADFQFSPFFNKIEFIGKLKKLDKPVILGSDSEFYYIDKNKNKNKKRITNTKELLYEISPKTFYDSIYYIDEKTGKRYKKSFTSFLCRFRESEES